MINLKENASNEAFRDKRRQNKNRYKTSLEKQRTTPVIRLVTDIPSRKTK